MLLRTIERDSLFSVIAGPLVWSVHFLSIYVFTAIACARGFFHDEILGIRTVPLVGSAFADRDRPDRGRALRLLASLARRWRQRRSLCHRMGGNEKPAGGASWPTPASCYRRSRDRDPLADAAGVLSPPADEACRRPQGGAGWSCRRPAARRLRRAERTAGDGGLLGHGERGRGGPGACPDFEAHPGIAVRVQQILERRSREAAHGLGRRRHARRLPARQHLGPGVRRARAGSSPLDDRLRAARRIRARGLLPGILETNQLGDRPYSVPWYVDTRCCSSARISWRAPATLRRRRAGRPGSPAWRASERAGRRRLRGDHPADSTNGRPVILALQHGADAAVATATTRQLPGCRPSAPRSPSTVALPTWLRAARATRPGRRTSTRALPLASSPSYMTGPWNLGELAQRLPAELHDEWGGAHAGATTGATRARRCRRGEHRDVPRLEHRGRRLALSSLPHRPPRNRRRFNELIGPPAGTAASWTRARLDRSPRALLGAAAPRSFDFKIPEWERIAITITAREVVVRGDATPEAALARSTPRWIASSRSGAGCCARAPADERLTAGGQSLAGWVVRAPGAVADRGVLLLPVIAGLALSLTDFDIYAIADRPIPLRFVGLANFGAAPHRPAVLDRAAEHHVLRRWWAGRSRSRCRFGGGAPELEAARASGPLPLDLLPPGRDHAGRGGGRVALPLPPALRPPEPRPRIRRHRADRLARRPALGDAGDVILWRCGRTSATTCSSSSPGCRASPSELYEAARSTAPAGGAAAPPRHAADARADLPVRGRHDDDRHFQLFAEPYVMTQGGPLDARRHRAAHVRGGLPLVAWATRRRSPSCCSRSCWRRPLVQLRLRRGREPRAKRLSASR